MLQWALDRWFIKQPRLRRVVTNAIYGNADVLVNLFGSELTINAGLENGYFRGFRSGQRLSIFRDEAAALINLAGLVSGASAFIDAGANIGVFSAVMSRLKQFNSGLIVVAFEVDPKTFSRLADNARRHGFQAHNVGLADAERMTTFVRGAVSHVTTLHEGKNSYNIDAETFTARCAPLSAFDIPGNQIVIKIDVEGFEYEVLLGARSLFEKKRVKAVYLDGVSKLNETQEFLTEYGFRLLDGRTLQPWRPENFALLAVMQERAVQAAAG